MCSLDWWMGRFNEVSPYPNLQSPREQRANLSLKRPRGMPLPFESRNLSPWQTVIPQAGGIAFYFQTEFAQSKALAKRQHDSPSCISCEKLHQKGSVQIAEQYVAYLTTVSRPVPGTNSKEPRQIQGHTKLPEPTNRSINTGSRRQSEL